MPSADHPKGWPVAANHTPAKRVAVGPEMVRWAVSLSSVWLGGCPAESEALSHAAQRHPSTAIRANELAASTVHKTTSATLLSYGSGNLGSHTVRCLIKRSYDLLLFVL